MQRVAVRQALPLVTDALAKAYATADKLAALQSAVAASWRALAGHHLVRLARGFLGRARAARHRRALIAQLAATRIQAVLRGHRDRRDVVPALWRQHCDAAATRVQAAWRGWVVWRWYDTHCRAVLAARKTAGALAFQAAWRGHAVRARRPALYDAARAARQAGLRLRAARLERAKARKEAAAQAAALTIQRVWRGLVGRRAAYALRGVTTVRHPRVAALANEFLASGDLWGFLARVEGDYRAAEAAKTRDVGRATAFVNQVVRLRRASAGGGGGGNDGDDGDGHPRRRRGSLQSQAATADAVDAALAATAPRSGVGSALTHPSLTAGRRRAAATDIGNSLLTSAATAAATAGAHVDEDVATSVAYLSATFLDPRRPTFEPLPRSLPSRRGAMPGPLLDAPLNGGCRSTGRREVDRQLGLLDAAAARVAHQENYEAVERAAAKHAAAAAAAATAVGVVPGSGEDGDSADVAGAATTDAAAGLTTDALALVDGTADTTLIAGRRASVASLRGPTAIGRTDGRCGPVDDVLPGPWAQRHQQGELDGVDATQPQSPLQSPTSPARAVPLTSDDGGRRRSLNGGATGLMQQQLLPLPPAATTLPPPSPAPASRTLQSTLARGEPPDAPAAAAAVPSGCVTLTAPRAPPAPVALASRVYEEEALLQAHGLAVPAPRDLLRDVRGLDGPPDLLVYHAVLRVLPLPEGLIDVAAAEGLLSEEERAALARRCGVAGGRDIAGAVTAGSSAGGGSAASLSVPSVLSAASGAVAAASSASDRGRRLQQLLATEQRSTASSIGGGSKSVNTAAPALTCAGAGELAVRLFKTLPRSMATIAWERDVHRAAAPIVARLRGVGVRVVRDLQRTDLQAPAVGLDATTAAMLRRLLAVVTAASKVTVPSVVKALYEVPPPPDGANTRMWSSLRKPVPRPAQLSLAGAFVGHAAADGAVVPRTTHPDGLSRLAAVAAEGGAGGCAVGGSATLAVTAPLPPPPHGDDGGNDTSVPAYRHPWLFCAYGYVDDPVTGPPTDPAALPAEMMPPPGTVWLPSGDDDPFTRLDALADDAVRRAGDAHALRLQRAQRRLAHIQRLSTATADRSRRAASFGGDSGEAGDSESSHHLNDAGDVDGSVPNTTALTACPRTVSRGGEAARAAGDIAAATACLACLAPADDRRAALGALLSTRLAVVKAALHERLFGLPPDADVDGGIEAAVAQAAFTLPLPSPTLAEMVDARRRSSSAQQGQAQQREFGDDVHARTLVPYDAFLTQVAQLAPLRELVLARVDALAGDAAAAADATRALTDDPAPLAAAVGAALAGLLPKSKARLLVAERARAAAALSPPWVAALSAWGYTRLGLLARMPAAELGAALVHAYPIQPVRGATLAEARARALAGAVPPAGVAQSLASVMAFWLARSRPAQVALHLRAAVFDARYARAPCDPRPAAAHVVVAATTTRRRQ